MHLTQKFAELFQAADGAHSGVMLALYPSSALAQQIAALEGVETAADELHITLCYLGKLEMVSDAEIAAAILAAERVSRRYEPLVGKLGGIGRFNASSTSDGKDAIYANVDLPGLERLRDELVSEFRYQGGVVNAEHGFTPHMTLAYVEPEAESPVGSWPTLPLRVDAISVVVGGSRKEYPLTGTGERELYGEVADLCADGHGWRLFVEAEQYIEPPEWLPLLPSPDVFQHPEYGEISITRERNTRFVNHIKEGVYQDRIPVDAEHELKASGAVGWIVDARLNEDGSADGKVEWNERGKALLKDDRFAYVSPEWYETWKEPTTGTVYQDVAIGAALTNHPFFKTLRPLIASERGLRTAAKGSQDIVFVKKEAGEMGSNEQPIVDAKQFGEMQRQMGELQKTVTGLEQKNGELSEALAASESERKEAEAQAQKYQESLDASNKRIADLEAQNRRKRFAEMVSGRTPWYGDAARNVARLEKLAEAFGEESDDFKEFVAEQQAIAAQMADSKLFVEIGSDRVGQAQTAAQRIDAEARKLMAEDAKLTHAQAIMQAAERNPQLYGEYVQEMRGGR